MREHTFACRDDNTGLINVWDVYKLWEYVDGLPSCDEPLFPLVQAISDNLNEYTSDDWLRVKEANLEFPIIIYGNYCIIDGCHRIAKAMLNGAEKIKAVRIKSLPPPLKTYYEWIEYCFDYPPL